MNDVPKPPLSGELIEVSFAKAMVMITGSEELSAQTKQHWICALRQIAKAMDRPMETIPARYSAVRTPLRLLHHGVLGITAKTLANHKSNVKAALLWLSREKDLPRHGAPLAPQWEVLRLAIADKVDRSRLSPLLRYCSAKGTAPELVDETVVDGFMHYRATSSGRPAGDACRRLYEPAIKPLGGPTWEEFPAGLRWDIEAYLALLTTERRSRSGQRIRPLKLSTIGVRRAELVAATRMAIQTGVPIESLMSLGALLAPDMVRRILDAYWKKNGDQPKTFTINLAVRFLSIARETGCIDDAGCNQLNNFRQSLEDRRRHGMTDKNQAVVRQVLTTGVWDKTVKLPHQLMKEARFLIDHAPNRAAVMAQLAVAIAILTVAPIRLANLTSIRLGINLIKPGGPNSNYWLVFPDYDVKNRVRLEFVLDERITALIDEYVHDMRPVLLRAATRIGCSRGNVMAQRARSASVARSPSGS